jgi:hypothetical protein
MSLGEAREVPASEPPNEAPRGEILRWSNRYAEAWMVKAGTPPEQIKSAMEHLTGYRLD